MSGRGTRFARAGLRCLLAPICLLAPLWLVVPGCIGTLDTDGSDPSVEPGERVEDGTRRRMETPDGAMAMPTPMPAVDAAVPDAGAPLRMDAGVSINDHDAGTTTPDAATDTAPSEPPVMEGCGSDIEQAQLALTNSAREDAGLVLLECDPDLTVAARLHSEDMCTRGYFDHDSLDGRKFTDRITAQGVRYGYAGENIAWGQRSAAEVHESWMNSTGHRENILTPQFRRIGIGYFECGGSPYWTQDFTD